MLRFFELAILSGVPFGLAMGVYFGLTFGVEAGVASALALGPFFGLSMAAFAAWQGGRFAHEVPACDGETLLRQGPANHFKGIESVGGRLYLTNRRLLFRSHRLNVQNHELSIGLGDIEAAWPARTAWVVPNGLRVATAGGVERFVVEGRKQWADEIARAKSELA